MRLLFFYLALSSFLFSVSDSYAFRFSSASELANQEADKRMYSERRYENAGISGPEIIVLPGEIKSSNATFLQKITSNNIKDFAEIELANANFRILERGDLNPMLEEQKLAAEMGSAGQGQFKKGQFKTTRWMVRFDILKAEPVAQASQGFDGGVAGNIAGALIKGRAGSAVDVGVSSLQHEEAARVWIIGLKYKLMDAATSQQLATGYLEKKMEVDANANAALGFHRAESKGVTLDSMVQMLIQDAVARIDRENK